MAEQDDKLKPSTEYEYGSCNSITPYDDAPSLDVDDYDVLGLVSKQVHDSAYKVQPKKDNRWNAIVMRIEEKRPGYCRVTARIPECPSDSCKPEPAEFVPRTVESNSHYVIDMHRQYEWYSTKVPKIGQKITVSIPEGGTSTSTNPGTILAIVDGDFVGTRFKSSKVEGQPSAPAASNSLDLQGASGDPVGSGQSSAGNQVP